MTSLDNVPNSQVCLNELKEFLMEAWNELVNEGHIVLEK